MHKMALWEDRLHEWAVKLDTHLKWRYCTSSEAGEVKRRELVLEMQFKNTWNARFWAVAHLTAETAPRNTSATTQWSEKRPTHSASGGGQHISAVTDTWSKTWTETPRCRFFTRPLHMLMIRGRQRPGSVNSWPTWGDREATGRMLRCVVLCLYIIQLELNDNQRGLRIRGCGSWSRTVAAAQQHLWVTHSSEARSFRGTLWAAFSRTVEQFGIITGIN